MCISHTHTHTLAHTHTHTHKHTHAHTHTHTHTHTHALFVEVKSMRAVKTSTLSQIQDEKDYFQVTDELAKENSHFALSEALLAVVEQVSSWASNMCSTIRVLL